MLIASPVQAAEQSIVFADVNVVDVAEGVILSGMTLSVSGDRIDAVGKSSTVSVPSDAREVDGRHKYLIPGLWDLHVHTSTDRATRSVLFPLFVGNGVTGIPSMERAQRGLPGSSSAESLALALPTKEWLVMAGNRRPGDLSWAYRYRPKTDPRATPF